MKAVYIQNSPILEPGRLEDALSGAMEKSLKEYAKEVEDHQNLGAHTGVVRNVKIDGKVIRHQPSRKGESPSPLSKALVESVEPEQFSPVSGEVRVTKFYGKILQEKQDRDILKTPEAKYEPRFQQNVNEAVEDLF